MQISVGIVGISWPYSESRVNSTAVYSAPLNVYPILESGKSFEPSSNKINWRTKFESFIRLVTIRIKSPDRMIYAFRFDRSRIPKRTTLYDESMLFSPIVCRSLTTIDPRGTRFFFFFCIITAISFSFPLFLSLRFVEKFLDQRFINARREIGWWLREKLMESCTNDNPLLMSSAIQRN